jgi:hypothetical protein
MSANGFENGEAAVEAYVPFTPFQASYAFEPDLTTVARPGTAAVTTPFVTEYFHGEGAVSPEAHELQELLFELFDPEFDELLAELAQEAWTAATDRFEEFGETLAAETTEQFLEEWVRPVREQAETMLDNIAEAAAEQELSELSEHQIDELFERFEPHGTGLESHFEDFLGGLVKKAKSVVKGAVKLAKRGITMLPGISALLGKLKRLVHPLLQRVLKLGLDKLPPQLQPVARQLAQRILGQQAPAVAAGAPAEPPPTEQPTLPDAGSVQGQFDLDAAALLFATEEVEQEVLVGEVRGELERADGAPLAELHLARERFVDELEGGADLQESLERFIPAVMGVLPIARTAIRLVGRPRVVDFLAKFLTGLLRRYLPPEGAGQLSRAIVDAGLRMVSLEAPAPDETEQLAPAALAGAVEDTVRRVAQLDETTLDQPALLEAAVADAFQEAAAENFPPELLIPEVHEASIPATWVQMPLGRRRKYYKRYTHSFDVEVTPQMAASIKVFGGTTLAAFLKDRLRVNPPLRARIRLYQATAGTTPPRIARYERVPGLGPSARAAASQLHPLTPQAAAILLREPKLGRPLPRRFLASPNRLALGQRLYHVDVSGPGPGAVQPAGGRSSQVSIRLDLARGEFRLFAYLSEADAQEVAAKLRSSELPGALALLRRSLAAGIDSALGDQLEQRLRISPADGAPGRPALIPADVRERLGRKLVEWASKAAAEQLEARAGELISATEAPQAGVTTIVTAISPPVAGLVRKLVRGGRLEAGDADAAFREQPTLSAQTLSGFHRA